MKGKKNKKAKKEISSEIVDDDYADDVQGVVPSPIPPAPPRPVSEPEVDEDQVVFNDWLKDWHQRFQYFSDLNTVASQPVAAIKNQELILLVGLAHNSDRLVSLQGRTNKLLKKLVDSQVE